LLLFILYEDEFTLVMDLLIDNLFFSLWNLEPRPYQKIDLFIKFNYQDVNVKQIDDRLKSKTVMNEMLAIFF
jgi:hypothetical protein